MSTQESHGPDFVKGASGPASVYDTSPSGLGLTPAYLANGANASASSTAGTSLLAQGSHSAPISTTGTTFGTGADVLTSDVSFTADGMSDYVVKVSAYEWSNNTTSQNCVLHLNLDSADGGTMGQLDVNAGISGKGTPLSVSTIIVVPAAGAHTVNARLRATGGTATITASTGGTGNPLPALLTVEKLG